MRKTRINLSLDVLTLILMLTLIGTGLVVRYVLPPGSGGRRGGWQRLWGWSRHEWGDLHFWLSLGLCGLVVLHIALHWNWVCETIRRVVQPAAKSRIGGAALNIIGAVFVTGIAAILGGFFLLARASVVSAAGL